jgi:hypothetical protein
MNQLLLLFFRVWIFPAFGMFFANPVGYVGRGSIIAFTPTPVSGASVYTPMPQLEKFEKSGSKADFDDATCLDSPGVNKFPIPIVVDNGKYTAEGVYDPQNAGITALQGYLQALEQLGYKLTLIDGSTLVGLCYVSQFETPKVDRYKVNRFSFEIMVYGVEVLTPLGGSPLNV